MTTTLTAYVLDGGNCTVDDNGNDDDDDADDDYVYNHDRHIHGDDDYVNATNADTDMPPMPSTTMAMMTTTTTMTTGDDKSHRGETAHEARLNFTTGEGERDSGALTVANDGTTAIYFNWKKVFKPNHFDIRREKVQRFYFNAQNGTGEEGVANERGVRDWGIL